MAKAAKTRSEEDVKLDQLRCRVCGKFHPFITVCPYIKSVKVEQLRDTRNPSMRGRITTTEYFPRDVLMEDAVSSLEEAQEILDDSGDSKPAM